MTVKVLLFAYILLFSWPTFALYSSTDSVISLTNANFDKEVLQSDSVWIVEYYAPWCGHCQNLAPEYKKAAANLKGLVKVGAVDCNEDANKPVCGRFGIQGFPTIKLFPGDRKGTKKFAIDYNGARTAKAIAEAGLDRLPMNLIKQITSKSIESFYEKKNQTLSKVILFTDKPKTTNLYKALSLEFKSSFLFGQVKKSESTIVESFGITSFPTLLIIDANNDNAVITYDGKMSVGGLTKFLNKYAKESHPIDDTSDETKSEKKRDTEPEPFDPKVPEIQDQSDYKKHCEEVSAKGYSSLCFIAFLPPLEPEIEQSVQEHESNLKVLADLKRSLYDMRISSPSSLANFHVSWTFGYSEERQNMLNRFGVATDLPSCMVIHPSKKVYAPFIGQYEVESLKSFLRKISEGRGRVLKYNWDIDFGSSGGNSAGSCSSNTGDAQDGSCKFDAKQAKHNEL